MVDPSRPSDSRRVRNDEPPPQDTATPPKAKPSAFDEVLRQNRQPQSPQQQQSAQQGATTLQKEVVQRDGRQQEQRERKQDKAESREDRSSDSESRSSSRSAEPRVQAKTQQQDREGGGGQGQGQFGGGRGDLSRETRAAKAKEGGKSEAQAQTQAAFAAQLRKAQVPQSLSAHHIQEIVNKVMQYFRLKKLTTGETELQVGFQEEIFKGLRLRLVQKDGRVLLHILSVEGDVRRLFEKSRAAIEKALSDKGVKLSQIVIGTG